MAAPLRSHRGCCRFVVTLALSVASCTSTAIARANGDRSVKQIVDTLHHLRASLDETGRNADTVQAWVSSHCNDALRRFGSSESDEISGPKVKTLQGELEENNAAVEETEGMSDQIRADMALVEHTLSQIRTMRTPNSSLAAALLIAPSTHDDRQVLTNMGANKQQTLTSLRGELAVLMPSLAQLQDRNAELAQRLEARSRSSASSGAFLAAVRGACSDSFRQALTQSSPLASQQNLINSAMAALQQLTTVPGMPTPSKEASFVQLGSRRVRSHQSDDDADDDDEDDDGDATVEVDQDGSAASDQDIQALFSSGDGPEPAGEGTVAQVQSDSSGGSAHSRRALETSVRSLIKQLRATSSAGSDDKAWCESERARSQLALRLAKAASNQLAAEMAAHEEAEADLDEDVKHIDKAAADVQAAASEVSASLSREAAHLSGSKKDLVLASKILMQAVHILTDLQSQGMLQGVDVNANVRDLANGAVDSLQQANDLFVQQASKTQGVTSKLVESARSVNRTAAACAGDLALERAQLQQLRETHENERRRGADSQRQYQADTQEVGKYAAELEKACGADASRAEAEEREVELQALNDAEGVLAGRRLGGPSAAASSSHAGLRGAGARAEDQRILTPLERAAQEMGVPID